MNGGFGFWEVLALAAAVQGVLLSAVIWTHRRGNRSANRLLGALLLLYSIQLLEIVLYWTRSLLAVPHFWGVSWFFPYLYGVLLFFYARALTRTEMRLTFRHSAHLVPFLCCLLLFAPFYWTGAEAKRQMMAAGFPSETGRDFSPNLFILSVWLLQIVHFTTYLALSARRLARDAREGIRHAWLRRLFIAFGISFACWFLNGLAVALGTPYRKTIDYAASLAMTATIYAIGYTALRQPELFLGSLGRPAGAKYEKSTLTPDRAVRFQRRLIEVMKSSKPYRDADLRLGDLARQMGVHPHHLSQVINQHFKRNFNEFVNLYRVEEAKQLMSDPARSMDTLLDLALEAGFNNKTSFNQAFKKHTGMTPSLYRLQSRKN